MSHTIQSYWESLTEEGRIELLDSLYIQSSLADKSFFDLPGHIRFMFYTKWNSDLEKKVNSILKVVHEKDKK